MRKKTIIIMILSVVGLSLYDAYADSKDGVEATISQILTEAAKERPIIATAIGILIGHWFWK